MGLEMNNTKKEMIEMYGNDFAAFDVTDYYKPLVLCYIDDESVLAFNPSTMKYHHVKLNRQIAVDGDYYFTIEGKRYHLNDFVRTGTVWTGEKQTLNEWIESNGWNEE